MSVILFTGGGTLSRGRGPCPGGLSRGGSLSSLGLCPDGGLCPGGERQTPSTNIWTSALQQLVRILFECILVNLYANWKLLN